MPLSCREACRHRARWRAGTCGGLRDPCRPSREPFPDRWKEFERFSQAAPEGRPQLAGQRRRPGKEKVLQVCLPVTLTSHPTQHSPTTQLGAVFKAPTPPDTKTDDHSLEFVCGRVVKHAPGVSLHGDGNAIGADPSDAESERHGVARGSGGRRWGRGNRERAHLL